MSYFRNNHVVFKLLLYPHVCVRILKNDYEYTRKKVRHFTIHLCYYYDYSIYISIMITAITFCILAISTIILQVIKDRKDYYNHHDKFMRLIDENKVLDIINQ